mmetsp:Transcript_113111/g.365403  ORF Transcript_113111/g.365403 Transcript_113111/m.365403 type:complete len:274 (-) Transcript_113111:219-1040(-)
MSKASLCVAFSPCRIWQSMVLTWSAAATCSCQRCWISADTEPRVRRKTSSSSRCKSARSWRIRCSMLQACPSAARCNSRISRCASARCARICRSFSRMCSTSSSATFAMCCLAFASCCGSSRSSASKPARRLRSAWALRSSSGTRRPQVARKSSSLSRTSASSERRAESLLASSCSCSSTERSTVCACSTASCSACCARLRAAASRSLRARHWLLRSSTLAACESSSKCHSSASLSRRSTTGALCTPPTVCSRLAPAAFAAASCGCWTAWPRL